LIHKSESLCHQIEIAQSIIRHQIKRMPTIQNPLQPTTQLILSELGKTVASLLKYLNERWVGKFSQIFRFLDCLTTQPKIDYRRLGDVNIILSKTFCLKVMSHLNNFIITSQHYYS
jgi:hypothetical protein